ncbi:hypothetical protein FVR03_00305 [Pontibacter qinzhouensis]|uniref:YcxB family protein n=1 Tax=Pontibacter qinzhouensis TaxID=2603253 RepID=A0A5C8KG04_9BACT|nr:hypothetical protein [Pontibacter qinzhouensis]TXK52850.1 hypothetical protein FVR03_00305 [Pontibacter qinzhouensis]
MEAVPVHTSFEETYRQLLFIDRFILAALKKKILKRSFFYLGLTAVMVAAFFFTDSNVGAVGLFLSPVLWLCFGLYLLYLRWKTHKRRSVTLRDLATSIVAETDSEAKLSFTEEAINFMLATKTHTLKWSEFQAYLEEENTVYLFQDSPYAAWSFSDKEIAATAVKALKELAKRKLPVLSVA